MKKYLLTAACVAGTLLSASAGDFAPERIAAREGITVSRGTALADRRQATSADTVRLKALPYTPPQSVEPAARKTPNRPIGIGVYSRKSQARKPIVDETSALLFESFESCELQSDRTPDSWGQLTKSDGVLSADDHWLGFSKLYADYNMFAPPAHGSMMFGIFYNDDMYKDQWLVAPAVTIPAEGYELSFYWYTLPYYMYVIDRYHVDFNNKVFTDRELTFDVEVYAKAGDADWERIFHIEELFADLEYGDLEFLDYDEMQRTAVNLDRFAGKDVQIAFRYYGEAGNSFFLDAVRIDLPLPDVSFMPHYSRLFYGFSPDQDMWWMDASIELYPVNHPVEWYNTSADIDACDFRWDYCNLDGSQLAWYSSDESETLSVTYAPDYSSAASLMNNFFFLPRLTGRSPQGGISDPVAAAADFLQAGGTTEFTAGGEYTKYVALPFDIINEGFGLHLEEDEELGFLAEPIFGRSVNTDAWWERYCFPDGKRDDQYAYVDGFANLLLPHPTAPLVVRGISAAALGKIYPEAQFTLNIYTMDEDGTVIEQPLHSQTIAGVDVITIPGYSTSGDFLVLTFPFDNPLILDAASTGYGYIVEVCGYHDENIEYFAPIQSTVPNEYDWALGFYHIHHSGHDDLTNAFSYVCFFTDGRDRDLYSSFAIGLDAHYPWLQLADADNAFTVGDDAIRFRLQGYYSADDYTVSAPDGIAVSLSGKRYLTDVAVSRPADPAVSSIPVTFTAPGVSLTVDVPTGTSAVTDIVADSPASADIYNAQGILVAPNAGADVLSRLPAGLYIRDGKKILVK